MEKIFLLADDDIDDRQLFNEALADIDSNIKCISLSDGQEVVDLLANERSKVPDIIFLDVNMPNMNGWQCLTELKKSEAYKHIPVLILSTSAHPREANIALDLGALCFFTKPVNFVEMKNMLNVISSNLNGNLLEAFGDYNFQKSKNLFIYRAA